MIYKKLLNLELFLILLIFLTSLFALKDLAKPNLYTSHDGITHTARIAQYSAALKDGQIPPRYAKTFYNYLGSPIFVYIYPLPYLLGSLIHFIGFNLAGSFKILMALGFTFSGIFCYFWLKELVGEVKAAFLGALFYMFSPYRLSLVFVRGSISELLAYSFLPLVLLCITKLARENTVKNMSLTAISFAFLLLSQNLVALISLIPISIYVTMLYLSKKSIESIKKIALALFWGFAIASVTYLPSMFERSYVKFDYPIKNSQTSHFVTLKQVLYSPWGYGFDLPGTVNDQMSFQIGLAHWLVVVTVTFLLVLLFLIKRYKKSINLLNLSYPNKIEKMLFSGFSLTLIIAVFLSLEFTPNKIIWESVNVFALIDIPWRFLGIAALSISFFAAFVAKTVKSNFIVIIFVIFLFLANRNHLRINDSLSFDDKFFQEYLDSATQYSEFTPKWRAINTRPETFRWDEKVTVKSGIVSPANYSETSKDLKLSLDVKSEVALIRVNKIYFPGVKVIMDEKNLDEINDYNVPTRLDLRVGDDIQDTGLIHIPISRGHHEVEIKYGETTLRKLANLLSLGSLVLSAGFIIKKRNEKSVEN